MNAVDIANYFVRRGLDDAKAHPFLSRFRPVTRLKANKLAYYAYGWHSGLGHGPLFDDEIRAEENGPEIKAITDKYIEYGEGVITKAEKLNVAKELHPYLKMIWDTYGKLPGKSLGTLSHKKDEPWYAMHEAGKIGGVMDGALIEKCFAEKLQGTG